jgi:peptidoglycan/LPS O-acetylase OafA/YrhL
VLSGFLITGILLQNQNEARYYRNFYARRFLRILPLYYALLFGVLVVIPQIPAFAALNYLRLGQGEFTSIWYWIFLSNFYLAAGGVFHHATLGVAWSLAIEEQFYLFWPVILRWVTEARTAALCVAILVAAPILRAIAIANELNALAVYVLAPFRLDGLALGALIAVLIRREGGLRLLDAASRVLLPSTLLIFSAFAWWWQWPSSPLGSAIMYDPMMQIYGYSVLMMIYGCFLMRTLAAPQRSAWARIFALSPLRILGKYSYAIYLFHPLVNLALNQFIPYWTMQSWQFGGLLLYCAASLGASLMLARLSWVALEAPARRLKRHFPMLAAEIRSD